MNLCDMFNRLFAIRCMPCKGFFASAAAKASKSWQKAAFTAGALVIC